MLQYADALLTGDILLYAFCKYLSIYLFYTVRLYVCSNTCLATFRLQMFISCNEDSRVLGKSEAQLKAFWF